MKEMDLHWRSQGMLVKVDRSVLQMEVGSRARFQMEIAGANEVAFEQDRR